ncbi:MAG: hypothetical protein AABX09_00690 [Thermoproteota archaeon]
MEPITGILSAVSIVNMIVLGILVFIFSRMYVRTKAQLPLGMIVFSIMLFLHNVIGAYAYFAMSMLFSSEIFPYLLGVHIAELAGILIFFKITWD